jgi:hypothetical protein
VATIGHIVILRECITSPNQICQIGPCSLIQSGSSTSSFLRYKSSWQRAYQHIRPRVLAITPRANIASLPLILASASSFYPSCVAALNKADDYVLFAPNVSEQPIEKVYTDVNHSSCISTSNALCIILILELYQMNFTRGSTIE